MSEDSFNLWLKRGRCSENVWMWALFPLLIPYAYYKVGMGLKGAGVLIAATIVNIVLVLLIGVGGGWLPIIAYGFFDIHNIAKEYNRVYIEEYVEH